MADEKPKKLRKVRKKPKAKKLKINVVGRKKHPDIWAIASKSLMAKQGIQSPTEVDGSSMTPVNEYDSSVAVAEPPNGDIFEDSWMGSIQDRDTDAVPRKTKVVERQNALDIFDNAEKTRIKEVTRIADEKQRKRQEEKQRLISNMDLSPPYHKNPEPDYRRDVKKYMATLILLTGAKESDVSLDDRINEYILETLDPDMLDVKDKKDKMEEFLHYSMSGYFAFCKERIKILKDCKDVPEESRNTLHKTAKDAYGLAFRTIARSSIPRNPGLKWRITKPEFAKLWDKNGELRERAMKVIDDLSEAFKSYFEVASMDEKSEYHRIMHPNGDQDSGMRDVLQELEKRTGLINTASKITTYT